MGNTIIDHKLLVDSILSQDGIIVGGYVRAWISNGNPTDDGWEDVDCVFPDATKANKAIANINDLFGNNAPNIDIRASSFVNEEIKSLKLISLRFDTFYCSCWKFDGEFKLLEPAKSDMSFNEVVDQTKNKIAQCIMPFRFYNKNPRQIAKMIRRKWKIIDDKKNPIPEDILKRISDSYKSVYIKN